MKHLFQTALSQKSSDVWLLILRVCIASMMLSHGIPKFLKLISGEEIQFIDLLGIGQTASMILSVFAEFFCSFLILFGIVTRFAAFSLIINMSVAVFVAHAQDSFQKKELALLYLIVYITFLILGAGKYSIDHFIYKHLKKN
jgi:putative oxidoreductase